MSERKLPDNLHRDTLAVRVAVDKSQYGENSEALYLTSSFVQPDAETLRKASPTRAPLILLWPALSSALPHSKALRQRLGRPAAWAQS